MHIGSVGNRVIESGAGKKKHPFLSKPNEYLEQIDEISNKCKL